MKEIILIVLSVFNALFAYSQEDEKIKTFTGHTGKIRSVCFSPDGKYALSGSWDKTLKLWDINTGSCIKTFTGHTEAFMSVCFSPDGKYALSGSDDKTLKLWDINTGNCIKIFTGHTDTIRSGCFSPDGKYALSGSVDKTLKLWDINTGSCIKTFTGHTGKIRSVCFSPDGKYALSGSDDKTLKLWDINSGSCIKTFTGHTDWVMSVCFSPDGKYALSGSWDKTLKLWDINTGIPIKTFTGGYLCTSVCFSPDGKYALSGGYGAMLWKISNGSCIKTFIRHREEFVRSVCFSPDGKYALSGSDDSTMELWDINKGNLIKPFLSACSSVCFSPDGKYALSGGPEDKTLKLWDINTGIPIKTFTGHTEAVRSVCFSPDGKYALSGSDDKTLKLWDINTGNCIKIFTHTDKIFSGCFSPDGKYALSGSFDSTMKLWDINTGSCIKTFTGHTDVVMSVCFSPDGKYALSGSWDKTLKLWDINTGIPIKTFTGHTGKIRSVCFSPDGKYALSGSDDKTLKLWDINTGSCIKIFTGHTHVIMSVCFSPDGKYALSGSIDSTMKLWDINSGSCIKTFTSHTDLVMSVCFSPDGKYALCASVIVLLLRLNYEDDDKVFDSPPKLSVSDIVFTDKNGNNRIDANEDCNIRFAITNSGKGSAYNLIANITNKNSVIMGLNFNQNVNIGDIAPGSTKKVEIPISGGMNLSTGTARFYITFEEQMGLPPDPVTLEVETKEFIKPLVKVVDNSFLTDNGTIKLGTPVQLKVLIQNMGQGLAEEVKVEFSYPTSNVFNNSENTFTIGDLAAGASKEVIFEFFANKLYTASTIPITIKLSEKYGKFAENKEVAATVNAQSSGATISIASNSVNDKTIQIQEASLSSDVDKNIPKTNQKSEHAYALIIGNEDYTTYQSGLGNEANVAFAKNDATVFKGYCINTLGIPEAQIKFYTDATAATMNKGISIMNSIIKDENGAADVIVYYAGHGLPDEQTKEPYLIPVNVSGENIQDAIKLSTLYSKLTEFPSKKITVFLDACFSGGGRGQGLIAARAMKTKPKSQQLTGKIVVFTSSSADQTSMAYKVKGHGLFTYYLLKKLQDTKADVSYSDLYQYLYSEVDKNSLLVNDKKQTPDLLHSDEIGETWKEWSFK